MGGWDRQGRPVGEASSKAHFIQAGKVDSRLGDNEMTLVEAIESLATLAEEGTIYAAEPWARTSTAVVAREPEYGTLPPEAGEQGLKYFLEVFIARDFIEDWSASLDTVAPGSCLTLQDTAPVPGRHWLRYLAETRGWSAGASQHLE